MKIPFYIRMAVLSVCLVFTTVIHADTVVVTPDDVEIQLGPHLNYFLDETAERSFADILVDAKTGKFQANDQASLSFGYTKSAVWVHFSLHNDSAHAREWVLALAQSWFNQIDVYIEQKPGVYSHRMAGTGQGFDRMQREHPNFLFEMQTHARHTQHVYMRFVSDYSIIIPLTLWDDEAFETQNINQFMLFGIFYGIIIMAVLYNLCIYLSFKEISYLYYVLFAIFGNLYTFTLNGLSYQYLWPNAPAWNLIALTPLLALTIFACNLFTQTFLDTKKYTPIMHRGFQLTSILALSVGGLSFFLDVTTGLLVITGLMIFWEIWNLVAPVICMLRGQRAAKYYLLAWVVFFGNALMFSLMTLGQLPRTFFTQYGVLIGIVIQVFLLSVALTVRISILRAQKDRAMADAFAASQAKTKFLLVMGHELRTPLNIIIGYSDILQDELLEEGRHSMTKDVEKIRLSGKKLLKMVTYVLEMADTEGENSAIKRRNFALAGLLDDVMQTLRKRIDASKLQMFAQPSGNCNLFADREKLEVILINLLENAFKFTEKGQITLTVNVDEVKKFPCIQFIVQDTGMGIPSDYLQTVFEPFAQVDPSCAFEGAGIGLAISCHYAKLMGGKISVNSEVGKGSRFCLSIPYCQTIVA